GSESVCVWDLQIVAFERDAYVATVLHGDAGVADAAEAYLNFRVEGRESMVEAGVRTGLSTALRADS
ncbi:MAG: hypothetical protein M3282_13015, partial [Gemmatimonadota bacterium]|nr:hypothetical protein [Gemmatimonadota bacterium]